MRQGAFIYLLRASLVSWLGGEDVNAEALAVKLGEEFKRIELTDDQAHSHTVSIQRGTYLDGAGHMRAVSDRDRITHGVTPFPVRPGMNEALVWCEGGLEKSVIRSIAAFLDDPLNLHQSFLLARKFETQFDSQSFALRLDGSYWTKLARECPPSGSSTFLHPQNERSVAFCRMINSVREAFKSDLGNEIASVFDASDLLALSEVYGKRAD